MDISFLKNGHAYLCTQTVYYTTGTPKQIGTVSFTKGKLYYISQGCYLRDDNQFTKNYTWYMENFERSAENDVFPGKRVKPKSNGKEL